MERSRFLWRAVAKQHPPQQPSRTLITKITPPPPPPPPPPFICTHCIRRNPRLRPSSILRSLRQQGQKDQRRHQSTSPADQPGFTSIVDNPPQLIRSGRRHKPWGLLVLATIPVTAFVLGCWQVQRLSWKTDLIAKFEDRLVKQPLPLPPQIDPEAVKDFDYRRVYARGKFRHDQEMLIGPRMHDGNDGFLVITPLEQTIPEHENVKGNTTILINRGWIPKSKASQHIRRANGALPEDEVIIEGLLREPWKKNMFTPDNKPPEGKWYFPDVHQMAEHVGSQPVWIEETMKSDLLASYDREARGVPIGRAAEVNLRNNHTQYIFTWFSLSLATSIMLWMVMKKPMGGVSRRIRQNKEW
ncbi:hypothetical protein DOTSEDRAFT_180795 [Dothistroma septosporum NZE10]|uniref:SURF1-like protein n=2 Tax=Dothistroma septosporum TaxID=64363 RepID=M2Y0N2_DOTSN|nr:hypothetical protein [Dothistroma septosporum]EME38859.1 hypothetical protein DOTSEDRAFT_180795 [Dothistroma septosporum NZE10]